MSQLLNDDPDAGSHAPRRSSAGRRSAVWGLLSVLVVLLLGVAASAHQERLIDSNAEAALNLRSDAIQNAAEAEVSRYLGLVEVIADGVGSYDGISESKFRRLTSGVNEMGLDGATSVVLIAPPVATAGVASAQREWRQRFAPDLVLQPNDTRGEHVFSLTSVSLDGSPDRPGGIDVSVSPAPYAALMESRRSGAAVVSDAYQLIIDQDIPEQDRQTSFVLIAPVVNDGSFAGWVLMGLRGQSFLGHVLDVAAAGSVDTALYATDATNRDTQVAAVRYDLDGATKGLSRILPIAQQTWTLEIDADLASLIGPSRLMPRNTRIASGVAALLVGTLVWVLVTGRTRSAHKVRAATADLAAAEAISRRQASMLDAMVDTIDEVGVTIVDAEGRFLLQSRAARDILGIVSDEPGGPSAFPTGPEHWQENFGLFHLDGSRMAEADNPLARALNGESTDTVPVLVRNGNLPDGAQIEVSGRPLALGDGQWGALAVFRDVTQERLAQAELAGFAGVVAHDLRHPLTVIGGYIGMLTDHCLPDLQGDPRLLADTATYLAKATAGTARMGELISDLLDYTTARDAEMVWQRVDLNALAQEVAATHLGHGLDGAQPHLHVGDLPVIEGDPDRLRQLFANLIGNAVKYVAPGTAPLVDVSASEHGGRLRLRFADRGIGIAPDRSADVFRPFVRAHTGTPEGLAYTGTGLGLAICHQVVQRHGGDIRANPNPGGGSVFTVDLPWSQAGVGRVGPEDDLAGTQADREPTLRS